MFIYLLKAYKPRQLHRKKKLQYLRQSTSKIRRSLLSQARQEEGKARGTFYTFAATQMNISVSAGKESTNSRRVFCQRCCVVFAPRATHYLIVMQMSKTEQLRKGHNALVLVFFNLRAALLLPKPASLIYSGRKTHLLPDSVTS